MFKYTLESFNQLSIAMSKACRLLFTVDKKVTEKEHPITIYVKNVMLHEVHVEF